MPQPTIAVFDSGFGGLTILRAIVQAHPNARYIFLADQANAPYGSRSVGDIKSVSATALETLRPIRPDVVVIACNTATSTAISDIREQWYGTPVVGVEPALKPAVSISRRGRIGVLATPATLQSESYARLKREYASGVTVVDLPRPDWVVAIERGEPVDLRATMDDVQAHHLDTLVLGCTHFPILQAQLQAMIPSVTLVDSADAVARRVMTILNRTQDSSTPPSLDLRTTLHGVDAHQRLHQMWIRVASNTL